MTELNEFSYEVEFPPLTAVFVDEQPLSGHRYLQDFFEEVLQLYTIGAKLRIIYSS